MGNQVVFVVVVMVISIGISGLLISLLLSLGFIRGVGVGEAREIVVMSFLGSRGSYLIGLPTHPPTFRALLCLVES